jgi:hypothetical protein
MKKALYSVAEVADILKKSRQQINIDIRLGKIKAEKVGKAYVITYAELAKRL